MSPTIKDIAKAAGTDIRVVSLTLRDHPDAERFRQETRERIKRIAKEMGYERNRMAASVRTGVVHAIALVGDLVPGKEWVIPAELLSGIAARADLYDFQVRLFPGEDLEKIFSEIRGCRIPYVICTSGLAETEKRVAKLCKKYGLSLALLWENTFEGFPVVNTKIEMGAALAVEHLASLGHKRIGLITVPERDFFYIKAHKKAFRKALEKEALPLQNELLTDKGEDLEELKKFLKKAVENGPCGFFCTADSIAVRALFCARELGLQVPEELSIAGYGSGKYPAELAPIPLTAVRENPFEQGVKAVDLLLGKNGVVPEKNNFVYITPQLEKGFTTGVPRTE